MKLMAVDGNSIINRAFYGIRALSNREGTPTNAIYGFLNIFHKYYTEQSPDAVAVCFDVSRKTFRNEIYSDYKGTRKGMPDELRLQLPILKELLGYLGFSCVGLEGYEADDLIGTLSTAYSQSGNECVIITGDRDSLQLVDSKVTVLLPSTKMGKTETVVYTPQSVAEIIGVTPEQIVDLKALMGDSSDNIPGVAGIGQKTAVELINKFGTLDALYSSLPSDLRASVLSKLESGKDSAYLSKTLATINRSVPIDTDIESYIPKSGDRSAAAALIKRLELYSIMERFSLSADDVKEPEIQALDAPVRTLTLERKKSAEEIKNAAGDTLYYIIIGGCVYADCGDRLMTCDDVAGIYALDIPKYTFDAKAQYLDAQRKGVCLKNAVFDLKLAAYLDDSTASDYSVPSLCLRYRKPEDKCEYTFQFGDDESAIENAVCFKGLCDILYKKLEAENMLSLLSNIELPLSYTLSKMEYEGFCLDADGIRKFDIELSKAIGEARDRVCALAGEEFNLNSPKQLGVILFEKLGLPNGKKTKTGYSTNADVLDKLRSEHPIINEILDYRKLSKLKSTYTEGLLRQISDDGRIHTTFLQTETRTGRLSSIEPNLQNIPVRTEQGSRLREFFVAPNGRVLVDADYSQIELRVLAHVANDEAMLAAFDGGEDIHTATAAKVYGLPKSMITPEMRRSAKAVNFGIVYGIGAYSLSQDINTSVYEASRMIKGYLAVYSGVDAYMKQTVSDGERDGCVTTLYGRKRVIPELKNKNKVVHALGERIAMNTPIQGTAADIIKIAMNRVSKRLENDMPSAKLILQVHDELIVECDEKDAEKVKAILSEEMEKAADLKVRLETDVHIGKNWLEAKG